MEAYILFLKELQRTLCALEERLGGGLLTKYTNEETISIYKEIIELCKKYREGPYSAFSYSYSSTKDEISDVLESIQKKYYQLKQGYDGEEAVYKTLQLYDDQLHILRNYSFRQGEYEPEIDELVLTAKGIFCIEVKNWSGPCTINQAGYLIREKEGRTDTSSNIAFQTEQHVQNLRKLLKECSVIIPSEAYKGIVCWSNKSANVTNKCLTLKICYTNELASCIINDYIERPSLFSENDLQEIEGYLLKSAIPLKKYLLEPNPFLIKDTILEEKEREELILRYGQSDEFGNPLLFGYIFGIPNYYGLALQNYYGKCRLHFSSDKGQAEKELFELAKEFYLGSSPLRKQ